jgi:hypothetical protein
MENKNRKNIRIGGRNKKNKNSLSKYFGVTMNNKKTKWRAYFYESDEKIKPTIIGYFETELDAAIACNNTVLKIFGKNALLNIIEKGE